MSAHFIAVSTVRGALTSLWRTPRGDIAERLATHVTVGILTLTAAVLLTSHYWGEPIQCWVPAQYTSWWVQFVNNYCYVHGTYYVPLNEPLSWDSNERKQIPVYYYQWVPYVLALQAILFYIPHFAWTCICNASGVDTECLIKSVDGVWTDALTADAPFSARLARFESRAVPLLWDTLRLRRKTRWPTLFVCFLLVRILYVANAVLQWLWLNDLLRSARYPYWGFSILRDLSVGLDWQATGHFPRVTHCDFSQRKASSFNLESVLCVLTLNVYYEKIFIFLWFWLLFVAVTCTGSCIYWTFAYVLPNVNKLRIKRYLSCTESMHYNTQVLDTTVPQSTIPQTAPTSRTKWIEPSEGTHESHPEDVETQFTPHRTATTRCSPLEHELFTERYLRTDGMFLIRLIDINLGDLPAAYLCRAMFNSVLGQSAPAYHLHTPSAASSTHTAKLYATRPVAL